jgi:Fanconi anemia group M protein
LHDIGKTFIAAVVMHNYYRWFPHSKLIFMAPTRPLVQQQVEAVHKVRQGTTHRPLNYRHTS